MAKINSNQKGKAGEREFSNLCKEYGFDTRRSQQYSGANHDADVEGIDGLHIEVKRVEALNVSKAMKQAIGDAREEEVPIVAHRKNNEEWLITLRATDFLELYRFVEGLE